MFKKTRVGILGTGSIAGTMAKTLRGMSGVTCYAVASRTLEKAEKFAKENKIKMAYGSYQELCMDPKIDLIYVATPHSEHFSNTCLALDYGKNVLCEKAFALNEKQAKAMFELAAKKDVLLAEAMWTRFLPLGYKLREIIASNKIGDVKLVTADLSFNIGWKQRIMDISLGGGALLDLGVYGLTFASMVLGDDIIDISSAANMSDGGVDLQDSITLRYRSGEMAVITSSAIANGSNKGMIFGTNGHIEVNMINNFESITVHNAAGEKDGYYKREKQITGYEYEVQSVINALSQNWKECPEMPKAQTLRIMNMMDFIRGQLGIKFDADNESYEETTEIPAIEQGNTTENSIEKAYAETEFDNNVEEKAEAEAASAEDVVESSDNVEAHTVAEDESANDVEEKAETEDESANDVKVKEESEA